MKNLMTNRQRIQAVLTGGELDRIPFLQYTNISAPDEEIWKEIGKENMGVLKWIKAFSFFSPNCCSELEEITVDGNRGIKTVLHTPAGSLNQIKHFDPVLNSPATKEHYIKEKKDYEIFLAYQKDIEVRKNLEPIQEIIAEFGDNGVPHAAVGRTAFQKLWVEWVSIEKLCLHMIDWPDLLGEIIDVMNSIQLRIFDIAAEAVKELDLPYVVIPDNITAPIIGDRYFRQYCVPVYQELVSRLEGSVPAVVHMDGDLKPIKEAITESGIGAIDSFSPPPDNDTSAAEALGFWPDMRLMINFPSSVHLTSPENIYRAAMEILEQGGHSGRLWIQISENVPPGVWKKSYPEIIRAINDFGKP